MPEIIKTEAIVLNKMNYGDSSKISSFYSRDFGRFSALIKGGRSGKSKMGNLVDVFNHLQIVVYRKESRELQYISQADIICHYPLIKEDLDKIKYASAVIELIQNLIPENEANPKLFRGLVKILKLFNDSAENPGILLIKFILFLLKEIGFELQFENCIICGKDLFSGNRFYYNFERGFFCDLCKIQEKIPSGLVFEKELFNLFLCLRNSKNEERFSSKEIDKALFFLDRYLNYHIPEFRGIKSIHLF